MSTTIQAWRDPTTRRRADQLFTTMLNLLEIRLPYLRGRATRIDDGCRVMAEALRLPPDERYALSLAARFHDLGLLGVPDSILLKPGALTADEKTLVDCHTDMGGRLVHHMFPDFPDAIEAIWWHHERVDGRGPHGLRGDTIPRTAAIVALVEAVESMANDRPQRPAMGEDAIRAEIDRCAGTQFDAATVAAYRTVHGALYRAVAPAKVMAEVRATSPAAAHPPAPQQATKPGQATPSSPPAAATHSGPGQFPARRANVLVSINALTPLVKKQELVHLVSRGLEMKPLAPTVQAVISATGSAQCSGEEVARAVGQDQTLALRVLKVANSSAYSRGRHTDTLHGAVGRLGVQQIRKLVMGMGVLHELGGEETSQFNVRLFWEHSIACGLVAAQLARCCKSRNADDHFLWGMIHDVGRLILHSQLPDAYAKVWATAHELDVPLEQIEGKLLLLDHCGVLARALEHWQFPREFLAPVVNHHQSVHKLKRLAPRVAAEAMIIALADRIAHALLMGSSGNDVLYPLEDLLEPLRLTPETIEAVCGQTPDQVLDLRLTLMSRAQLENWPSFADSLRAQITEPFRPLTVSIEPRTNAVQMAAERLAAPGDAEPPNVGVLYARDAREQSLVMAQFESAEKEAGVSMLPLLLVWDKGRIDAEHSWLQRRRRAVLQMPLRTATLVEAINWLLP
jgi:HD-like signal output (HDOD) protein